ncbi:MAG TPA: ABC transporter permease [Streptosporangiaceae bacterium]|nr:ABC transporter permease [Streptosporangiaceae bacterium]
MSEKVAARLSLPRRRGWRSGSVIDTADEALAGLSQRPGRSIMTMLGTILGIGSFVAILGFTATAQGQISKQFSLLAATQIAVTDVGTGPSVSFPPDADQRVDAIRGVTAAGVWWQVSKTQRGGPVQVSAQQTPTAVESTETTGLQVTAADPGALVAMGAHVRTGRLYDSFAENRSLPVAVIGALAARELGIAQLTGYPAVFINGVPYTIIGIISAFSRAQGELLSVIIPATTALDRFGAPANPGASMTVITRPGAADVVARQVAVALRPNAPSDFQVAAPANPTFIQNGINRTVSSLFLLLAGISLIVGAVGIVNTTLVAVLERIPEIGLRRALGASRRRVAAQFLCEALALGIAGGLAGAAIAVLSVLASALVRHLTAVIPPGPVIAAPLAGAAIGLLAGIYPAIRAARVEPVQALQR